MTGTQRPTRAPDRLGDGALILIRALEAGGESAAAELRSWPGSASKPRSARELCYRLYTLCERKKTRRGGALLQ